MNHRDLPRRAVAFVRRQLGLRPSLMRARMLGRELIVPEGTIRAEPDYDDAWLFACALHSEVIFDVGANIGQSALLMLLSESIRQIVLVEPNSEALHMAAASLIRNHLSSSARFVPAFASDRANESMKLWTVGAGAAGSMYRSHAHSAARANRHISVPTVTVDGLCDLLDLLPDLVKVDVEGAELKVLQGSVQLAGFARTRFFVEMHSNPDMPMLRNAAAVLEWCSDVGFSAWYMKANEQLSNPAQLERRGRCHLLLQPTAWEYPNWLLGIRQGDELSVALPSMKTSHIIGYASEPVACREMTNLSTDS